MSSLAEELDQPIIVNIAGKLFKLGILDLSDLSQIQQEIRAELVAKEIEKLPNSHTADDIAKAERKFGSLTLDGLAVEVFMPEGAPRFLKYELRKGGMPEADIEKSVSFIGRKIGWKNAAYRAAEASGLFPGDDEKKGDGGNDPNQQAGTAAPATSD